MSGRSENVVELHGGKSKTHNDSQERIFEAGSAQSGQSIDLEDMDMKGNVIKKTVEFRVV